MVRLSVMWSISGMNRIDRCGMAKPCPDTERGEKFVVCNSDKNRL